MELRQLRYFRAVVEEGNLTRAARSLGLGSSALSEQIIALERQLDVRLFHRTRAGMVPTAAGRALIPHARDVLAAARTARQAVREAARTTVCWRVGVTPGSPHPLVCRLWELLTGAGVAAEPVDVPAAEQVDAVRAGRLDAGLVCLPVDSQGLTAVTVSNAPLGVLLRADHPLAGRTEVTWAELEGQELLWFARELAPGYHDDVLAACHAAGWWPTLRARPPRRALFTAELRCVPDLVALRPRTAVDDGPGLAWRPLHEAPHVRHALVWRAGDEGGTRPVVKIMTAVAAALTAA
ncbi:LysR family transcriptional regulator [Streptomyces albus]|uniref:LysR family transcriptional regulator n=1 Tax=Streptomyces albus TaxID=1888 RepID=UPI0034548F0D